jgi:hypothetical protein
MAGTLCGPGFDWTWLLILLLIILIIFLCCNCA